MQLQLQHSNIQYEINFLYMHSTRQMSRKSRCNKCENITSGKRDLDFVTQSGTHTASYKLCSHIPSPVLPTMIIIC